MKMTSHRGLRPCDNNRFACWKDLGRLALNNGRFTGFNIIAVNNLNHFP